MTEQTPETEGQAIQVAPEAGTRLEQLHASYADLKAEADAASERLKGITDAIKLELTQAAPDARRISLVGAAGPALSLSYSQGWRLDSKKLKAEQPLVYATYAAKTESWTLRAAKGGA